MSKWIRNLRHHLMCRPTTIVHGNVRDVYVDDDGQIYENLTALLKALATDMAWELTEFVSYDVVAGERRPGTNARNSNNNEQSVPDDLFAETTPDQSSAGALAPHARGIATWNDLLGTGQGQFFVFHYLDKFVSYKKSYTEEEQKGLLWLEKTIENMSENNRLVLVALQDSMVPVELYTHAPKTGLFNIPRPGNLERAAYLRHRLPPTVADGELIEFFGGTYRRTVPQRAPSAYPRAGQ